MKETKIGAEIGWGKNLVIYYITNNQLVHKRLHTNAHFPPPSPSSFQAIFKKYIMTNSDWIILDKIDFVLKRVRKPGPAWVYPVHARGRSLRVYELHK